MRRLLARVVCSIAIAGCTGGDGKSAADLPSGGFVSFAKVVTTAGSFAGGYAEFYSAIEPAAEEQDFAPPITTFPVDQCLDPQAPGGTTFTVTYADVGASVTLAEGPASLVLDSIDTGIYADPGNALPPAAGSTWDVSTAGSATIPATTWADGLHMPDADVSLSAPVGSVITLSVSSATPFRWTPMGATRGFLLLRGPTLQHPRRVCWVEDDGEFDLPAAVAAPLNSAGTMFFVGIVQRHVELEGRRIDLEGSTQISKPYQTSP